MPLANNEIVVGAVAYFDPKVLLADQRVQRPAVPVTRAGPFVCVQVKGDSSAWSPVTTQFRKERLEIRKEWRLEGSVQWRTDNLYLNDGANTYVGPNDAFVAAAARETPFTKIKRPAVALDGVKAAVAEIGKRHGRLL